MPTDPLVRRWLLLLLTGALVAFLIGGLMPGTLRAAIEHRMNLPFAVPPVAHFLLSALMAATLRWSRPRWYATAVLLVVLAVGVLAELAQVWVPGRQPSWVDMGFDLAGAVVGLLLVWLLLVWRQPRSSL